MFRFRPGDGRFAPREGLTVPRRVRVVRGLALDLDVVGDERGARPLNFGGRRAAIESDAGEPAVEPLARARAAVAPLRSASITAAIVSALTAPPARRAASAHAIARSQFGARISVEPSPIDRKPDRAS